MATELVKVNENSSGKINEKQLIKRDGERENIDI